MIQSGNPYASIKLGRLPHKVCRRLAFFSRLPGNLSRQDQPPHAAPKPRRTRQRRLRCDCGRLAITVLHVHVGSDPQYLICLPLCPACLNLEQELHG